MGNPVGFQGATHIVQAPKNVPQETVADLPVAVHDHVMISCWRLTDAELKRVRRTGVVWVGMMVPDNTAPLPIKISGEPMVILADGRASKAEPYIPNAKRRVGSITQTTPEDVKSSSSIAENTKALETIEEYIKFADEDRDSDDYSNEISELRQVEVTLRRLMREAGYTQ